MRVPALQRLVGLACFAAAVLGASVALADRASHPPPSPYVILGSSHLETPVIDGVDICIPRDLPAEFDGIAKRIAEAQGEDGLLEVEARLARDSKQPASLIAALIAARRASERADLLTARARLSAQTSAANTADRIACGRLESARLELLLSHYPEAAAESRLAVRKIGQGVEDEVRRQAASFYRAEALYRDGRPFQAHLAFRGLAHSHSPHVAAAARLRLTDLSFDAGKSESVKIEYEALLPRAKAYGASVTGWAVRAAEAAIDAGDGRAADAWLQRYLDLVTDRELRDPVEIRQADVRALLGEKRQARAMLRAMSARREVHPPGQLAVARLIDLHLSPESAEQRVQELLRVASSDGRGLRIYALGVLVSELRREKRLDDALAAATRLAYEGDSALLTPHYREDLAAILAQSVASEDGSDGIGCMQTVRRLGGRYPILIERARAPAPFMALGQCLETLQMSWMAVHVYRSLIHTFGPKVARAVALPLARASLASGDTPMAGAAAEAGVRSDPARRRAWKQLLAEVQLREGNPKEAVALLRAELPRQAEPSAGAAHSGLIFARALSALPAVSSADRRLLRDVLERLRGVRSDIALLDFGEACLHAADIERVAGDPRTARRFYAYAGEKLPPGNMRSESLFWQAKLDEDLAGSAANSDRWQSLIAPGGGDGWAELARFEASFESLRDRIEKGVKR